MDSSPENTKNMAQTFENKGVGKTEAKRKHSIMNSITEFPSLIYNPSFESGLYVFVSPLPCQFRLFHLGRLFFFF